MLPSIPSSNLPPADRYAYYKGLVLAAGGQVPEGQDTVLGLRGIAPDGKRHDSNENIGPYNDTFVVLTSDQRVREYRGSAHAGQKSSSISGPKGVAQIRPGHYKTVPNGNHDGMPSWHVRQLNDDGRIPCWRDKSKDGYISNSEKAFSESQNQHATAILFHNGVFEDHGSSIGCQTMPPKTMRSFIDEVGVSNGFYYTLINANQELANQSGMVCHSRGLTV